MEKKGGANRPCARGSRPVTVSVKAGRIKIGHLASTERVLNFLLRNAVIHTRGNGNGYPPYAGFASEDA